MSQVLATVRPYADDERDELLGYVMDDAKIVGQQVCALKHCSDGVVTPFSISSALHASFGSPISGTASDSLCPQGAGVMAGASGLAQLLEPDEAVPVAGSATLVGAVASQPGHALGSTCGVQLPVTQCGLSPAASTVGDLYVAQRCGGPCRQCPPTVGGTDGGLCGGLLAASGSGGSALGSALPLPVVGALAVQASGWPASVLEKYVRGDEGAPLAESLAPMVGATANTATQAGASQVPKTKLGPLAKAKTVDVATLVGRLRTSYPILRATAVDSALRQLLIAELVSQVMREDGAVVLPRELRAHAIELDKFVEFKD